MDLLVQVLQPFRLDADRGPMGEFGVPVRNIFLPQITDLGTCNIKSSGYLEEAHFLLDIEISEELGRDALLNGRALIAEQLVLQAEPFYRPWRNAKMLCDLGVAPAAVYEQFA